MNISSVSSNSNISLSNLNNNNEIKMLEKQKEQLQNQIKKINDSDMDSKIKQENIKLLKDQIQQIEMQIQQKQTEKLNQTSNQKKSEQSDSNGSAGSNRTKSFYKADIIQAGYISEKAEILYDTKNSLKGKGNVLKQEIELDESRGVDPKAKKAELQKMESNCRKLGGEFGELLQSSNNEAGKALETENKDSGADDKEKDKDINGEKNTKIDILV